MGRVPVQAAVVWQVLRVADVLLEDQVAPLPQTMFVLLVAQVAHLLVEFVVAGSVCGWGGEEGSPSWERWSCLHPQLWVRQG